MITYIFTFQRSNNGTTLVSLHKCEGLYDNRGCQGPSSCESSASECQEQIYDPEGCRIHSPLSCTEDQQECRALNGPNGCTEEPFCLSNDENCSCPEDIYDEDGCLIEVEDVTCGPDAIKCEHRT